MLKQFLFTGAFITIFASLHAQPSMNMVEDVYDKERTDSCCEIIYSDTAGNEYLREFRITYELSELTKNKKNDLDRTIALLHWTNKQWKHKGGNSAGTSDAFEILQRAAEGEGFSCAEYAIVFITAANSVGIPARALNLKTKNVETASSGAGHSLAEAYLADQGKWVMFDPQMDLVTYVDDTPLKAVELKYAVNNQPEEIKVFYKGQWGSENLVGQVVNWYKPYLHFLDVAFDNRYGNEEKYTCGGNENLFLVPKGDEAPKVFQVKYPLEGFASTHSVADFYQAPVFGE